jgi:hypothetical protein
MAYKDMISIDRSETGNFAWYLTELTLVSGTYSDIYRIPIRAITDIGAHITGSGYLEFSLSSLDALNANTATFAQWDGVAQINPAVTGFRMSRSAGTVVGGIIVKTQ